MGGNFIYRTERQRLFIYQTNNSGFRNQNIVPDMVQIGNEIPSGMLWNDGRVGETYDTNWTRFGDLLKEGIRGVKDAMTDTTVKIMIHIDKAVIIRPHDGFIIN